LVEIAQLIKKSSRKIVLVLTLTLIMYIAITGIFSIPLNQTTISFSIKAGGLSFYLVGALFLISVLKATFLEFIENSLLRSRGQKIFLVLHKFLGWIIFMLAVYHSLFFLCYYIWPVDKLSVSIVITGVCTIICLFFIMMSGGNSIFKTHNLESVYFRHIFATIVLISLIIIHLNFL